MLHFKKTLAVLPVILLAGVVSTGLGACDAQSEDPGETEFTDPNGAAPTFTPDADKQDWKFNAGTHYIKAPLSDQVQVLDGQIIVPVAGFEDLVGIPAGDVLIGGANSQGAATNPDGFLRKVKTVTQNGSNLVITTDAATIQDAFEHCDMGATWALPAFGDLTFTADDGSKMSPQAYDGVPDGLEPAPLANFDKSGTVLFDTPPLKATLTKASVSFTPGFSFAFDASLLHGLETFKAIATGHLEAQLEVQLATTAGLQKDFSKTFTAPVIPFPLGPLVVEVTPSLDVGCSVDIPSGITVTAGEKAVADLAIGVDYEKDTGLQPVGQHTLTMTRSGPTLSTPSPVTAKCSIQPKLAARISVVVASAGATLGIEGFGNLAVSAAKGLCTFDLDVGVNATADVNLKALGFDVLNKSFTLFSVDKKLADNVSCSAPSPL